MKHIIHDEYYEPCMDIETFQLCTDKLSLRYNSSQLLERHWFIRWLSYGLRSTHLGDLRRWIPNSPALQATMTPMTAEISAMRLDIGAFGKLGQKLMTSSDVGFNRWFIGNASHPKRSAECHDLRQYLEVVAWCSWHFRGDIQKALKNHDVWLGALFWGVLTTSRLECPSWTRLGDYFEIVIHRLRYPPVNNGIE